jgi:hypothetical protein
VSRIAEASARAGFKLPDEEEMQWDAERQAAGALLEAASKPHVTVPKPETIDFLSRRLVPPRREAGSVERERVSASADASELASAIRRLFLAPESTVRSVLFCSVPGDRMTDVAWRAAELLALEAGKPLAFVEEPSNRIAPATRHALITQIEWSDDEDVVDTGAGKAGGSVGQEIADLLPRFAYVLVNSAISTADELARLARQVDGVVVTVLENATSVDAAQSLLTSLRNEQVTLLGTIFVTERSL